MTGPKRVRQAVRALVIDHNDLVLLVKFSFPNDGPNKAPTIVWGVPGGGIDDGESEMDALRRELFEELGLLADKIGPPLWSRYFEFASLNGKWDAQQDVCHLLRVDPFNPEPTIGWEQMHSEYVTELRWWSVDELTEAAEVRFAPRCLADLVSGLIADGPPEVPPEVQ